MALHHLNSEELAIVGQCLRAAVEGPFFPDWEFHTLIGVSRDELRLLAARWHSNPPADEDADTVVSVLNNLVGYPHGEGAAWSSFIRAKPHVVSIVLDKVLAREPE